MGPLLAIAEVAGGDWPERARKVAVAACGEAAAEGSLLEILLKDIRSIFGERKVEQISSDDSVAALVDLPAQPWAEMGRARKPLTHHRLAKLLKGRGFAVISKRITVTVPDQLAGQPIEQRVRGYLLADFAELFERYLSADPPPKLPSGPNADNTGTSDIFQSVQERSAGHFEKSQKSHNDGGLDHLDTSEGGAAGETPSPARDGLGLPPAPSRRSPASTPSGPPRHALRGKSMRPGSTAGCATSSPPSTECGPSISAPRPSACCKPCSVPEPCLSARHRPIPAPVAAVGVWHGPLFTSGPGAPSAIAAIGEGKPAA